MQEMSEQKLTREKRGVKMSMWNMSMRILT